MRVFVDTSGWIAIVDDSDKHHPEAKPHHLQLFEKRAVLLTSNYVLAETYAWLRYHAGHQFAIRFHQMITAAEGLGDLEVLWVDRAISDAAWQIFEEYSDQVFSFVDCTSFVLARRARVNEVFAFDEHFAMMGFVMRP